jgi:MFS family permease
VGKGIRGAPRDALIADVTSPEIRGAAYGLRQSLDTAGALSGPILALVLMKTSGGNFRMVFWLAVLPGLLAVALLAGGVREPRQPHADETKAPGKARAAIRIADLKKLDAAFWLVVILGAILSLARFSEAFLLMRGQSAGMAASDAPLLMAAMNIVYFATAYPVGYLSDRVGRGGLLAAGIAALVMADLTLAAARDPWMAGAGAAIWGLQMGLTQGIFSAMVAGAAPPSLRGTAFGLFNLAGGIATIAASLLAGLAWDRLGAPAAFEIGSCIAGSALLFYLVLGKRMGRTAY